ncbi:hypothetical protein ABT143_17780 [Streptomyces sp. NPDC002033]|uniref:hypothetical protein n=1 Tax=unclassified Streptomyces TaxID=2593676 RepID=UPI00331BF08B
MTSSQHDRLRNLLVALSNAALELANDGVALAHPREGAALGLVITPTLQSKVAHVEALACAVLRHSGVSWDAMAGRYDVTRQSLHRRLSASADQVAENAQKLAAGQEMSAYQELGLLVAACQRLGQNFERELERAPESWEARRRTPGWWWEPGDK